MGEAFLQGAKVGLIFGAALGLIPLAVGFYKRRPKSAVLGFVGSLVLGALFGLYGALMFSAGIAGAIWRNQPIKGTGEGAAT